MAEKKDWFAVQLEVTQRLLEAETKRLENLALEAKKGGAKAQKTGIKTIAQRRLQSQYEQLNKEYDTAAKDMLKAKSLRSVPALGVGQKKSRASIFQDNMARRPSFSSKAGAAAMTRKNSDGSTDIDMPEDLVFEDSRVKSGTLDALVDHFIPNATITPNQWYSFTFLVTSRLFIAPHDLLATIASRIELLLKGRNVAVAERLVALLRQWKDTCAADFRDERMNVPFDKITKKLSSVNDECRALVKTLKQGIYEQLVSLEASEARVKKEFEEQMKVKRETLSRGKDEKTSLADICSDPQKIADQLMLVERERFCAISPHEFIQTFVRSDSEIQDTANSGSNIEAYIAWFNRLSYLIATDICSQSDMKKRAKLLELWISVGKRCQAMHNYNSLMAIISALNMNSLGRMKKTWSKGGSKLVGEFETLSECVDPSGNFKNYRRTIKALQDTEPHIPFFSLMVRDIYFINEGAAKKLKNGQLNFERLWPVSESLSAFILVKQGLAGMDSKFTAIPQAQAYLRTTPVCSELELFRTSVEIEPPSKADQGKTMNRLRKMSSSNLETASPDAPTNAS